MKKDSLMWLGLGAAVVAVLYFNRQKVVADAGNIASDIGDTVTAAITGWKSVGSASDWLTALGTAESAYGLPTDLLARMAYQESHFRDSIIRGTQASPAGALGILQLMPQYFHSVNAPVPFSDTDVVAQINEAAQQMQTLYHSTGDSSLSLAAYNAGLGNVQKYGGIPPFAETQKYVAQITADVPSLNA